MSKPSISARTAALLIFLVVLVAAAGAYLFHVQRNAPARSEDGCNLHERPCSAPIPGGGRATLGMQPRPLGFGKPWKLSLTLEETNAEKVEIDFSGQKQPASFNRVTLVKGEGGRFDGEATLPSCVFEPMDWQATVLIGEGADVRKVPFLFGADPTMRPKGEPRKELAAAPGGGSAMLRGADGPFGPQQTKGFATVLFFSYSRIPAECPQPLAVVDAALAKLSADERGKVMAVLISLDPDGDSPEKLQPQLQARSPSYRVATGADADLIGAAKLYGASFVRRPPGSDGKPRIDHSAVFSILDPTGRLVGQLAAQDSDKLAAELRKALGTATPAPAPAAK